MIIMDRLKKELLDDMKSHPWMYRSEEMRVLFEGVKHKDKSYLLEIESPLSRFLLSEQKLDYEDLINGSIIPPSIGKDVLMLLQDPIISSQDQVIEENDSCMDVFFLGYGWLDKTCIMASVLEQLNAQGIASYVYSIKTVRYYHELLDFIRGHKLPICVTEDSPHYVTCNNSRGSYRFICNNDYYFHLNHDFCSCSEIDRCQASFTKCIESKNKKILFFLIDSSILLKTENDVNLSTYDYVRFIENCVFCFSQNRQEINGNHKCTMNFVTNIVLLFTKFHVIELANNETPEDKIKTYVDENMRSLYSSLKMACLKYGINTSFGMNPLIMKHSIGDVYIGNTFEYNPIDAQTIVQFLIPQMPHTDFWGKFKKLFT